MVDLKHQLRRAARGLLPPVVTRLLRRPPPPSPSFTGDFRSYEEAARAASSSGYEDHAALARTLATTADYRARIARSPDVAVEPRVLQTLSAILLGIERAKGEKVRILDFGGGVGLHFFTLSPFLARRWSVDWTVCELPALVRAGREAHGGDIRFVEDLSALGDERFDVVLASGSIQYVPDPVATCEALLDRCDALVINRTPFISAATDRLVVQEVRMEQGIVRYPAWFLSRERWWAFFARRGYRVDLAWPVPEDGAVLDGGPVGYWGLLARRHGVDEVP